MNRIYQGRVSSVQIPKPGIKNEWEQLDPDHKLAKQKGEAALWEHHQLFHDAVNYYAFALAAMAKGMTEKDDDGNDKLTPMGQFAEQLFGNGQEGEQSIVGRWDDFTHKGVRRAGLKRSLSCTLGLDPKTVTQEQCIARILGAVLKEFPNRKDSEGRDIFHGVIAELFPSKSRGAPKNLANEDPGWLCWKNKSGEPPSVKTYRSQQGIYGFMAELFTADVASLQKLAALTVEETCLSGVTKAKDANEDDKGVVDIDNISADENPGTDADAATENVKHFTPEAAINQLRKSVNTAKTLLAEGDFNRDFKLLGGDRFNASDELEQLLKHVNQQELNEKALLKPLKIQEWKRNGKGKDNERVELFVLMYFAKEHCLARLEFTAALLMTRLKRRLLGPFRKASPQAYLAFVNRFNLAGSEAEGKEPQKQIDIATRALAKLGQREGNIRPTKTDFIPRIRKTVGYVFPSFTAIRCFVAQENDPTDENGICQHGYFGWPKFDNSAYEEAIKSPHQIREKEKERDTERSKLEALKNLYEGKGREKGKDDDGEEADHIPGFSGDARFVAMRNIHKAMAVADGVSEGRIYEYGISQAALRGYEDLREEWNKAVDANEDYSEEKERKLKACIVAHQQQHRDDMGDSRLFEELIKNGNWCVWQVVSKEAEDERVKKRQSTNMVRDYLRYSDVLEDLERKKRPVQYTPADASESRRLFDFKGASQGGFKHRGRVDGLSFTTQIAVKCGDMTKTSYRAQPVCIHYTAPRLLRDEARVLSESEKLASANWAQPMMRALGVPSTSQHDFDDHAVSLMPDWPAGSREHEPERLLLNFVLAPKEDGFITHLRQQMAREQWPWTMQFNWNGDGHDSTLRWPHEEWSKVKTKKEFSGQWFGSLNLESFRLLSVDLGQKQAGAYAVIEVSCCLKADEKGNARFIGKTEHEGQRRDWYARVLTTGLHKLPGEDAVVFRPVTELDKQRAAARGEIIPSGKDFREELSGPAGRTATKEETRKAIELLTELHQLELLDDDTDKAAIECADLSFPLQNAKLLIAFRRAQSFAGKLHRWCWFLDPQGEKVRDDQAGRRRTAIKEIAEADENSWLDNEARRKAKARHEKLGDVKDDPETHPEIVKALKASLEGLTKNLSTWLVIIANRVYSSRRGQLVWRDHPDNPGCHLLDFSLRSKAERIILSKDERRLGGQRGLSMERIEQLEELRKRCQSLNQMLRRKIGENPPMSRDDRIPDPCPTILAKLDEIKEQRRNQTAHMILAEALGLALDETNEPQNAAERELRETKDCHGEYVKVDGKGQRVNAEKGNTWRGVVDFIVIEDLSRYLTSQGRAPRENGRLMKWCHRAIRDKLKQMCEPFGLPLVETPAAYSSRFCSRTGVAGFRATEIGGDPLKMPKWRWRVRKPDNGKMETNDQIKRREQWESLFEQVQRANQGRDGKSKGRELRTLLAPDAGGSIFIPIARLNEAYQRPAKNGESPKLRRPIIEFMPVTLEENQRKQPRLIHADINAAVNLGLRAVSDPRLWSIHPRLRSEREFGDSQKAGTKAKRDLSELGQAQSAAIKPDSFFVSDREKRKYGERKKDGARITISLVDAQRANLKASDSRHPNFFADIANLPSTHYGSATLSGLPADNPKPNHLVSAKALWGYVKEQAWNRCAEINAARLRAWSEK